MSTLLYAEPLSGHMRTIGDNLTGNLGIGIKQYIADSSVENSGVWAAETEILATSSLLRTDI